jgi:nitrate/nitrite transporter NarK
VFVVFGAVGFVWAAAWFTWFRDDPAEHPAVNAKERAYITSGRSLGEHHAHGPAVVVSVLSNRNMIALCLMYFTQAYGFYFNITWLPTYLARHRGITASRYGVVAPLLAGLPLILSAAADVVGGLTTDRVTRTRGLRVGRCGVGFVSP